MQAGRAGGLRATIGRASAAIGGDVASAWNFGWIAIGLGIALRLVEYAYRRPLWLDEEDLLANVAGRPVFGFDQPMVRHQLAPPGFLAAVRGSWRVLGGSAYAVRFLPLVCGTAALVLLRAVARRSVDRRAVPIALGLAAVSWDLIYFATEFKQYSSDLAIALGLYLLGDSLATATRGLSARRLAMAGAAGASATWFSHPSVFVLAAVGMRLAAGAIAERRWGRLFGVGALGLIWGSGFASSFAISRGLQGDDPFLWDWWGFAFLPLPPRSAGEAWRAFWQVANAFDNPVGIATPAGPIGSALIGLALFLIGSAAMAARGRSGPLLMLVGPIALALLASAMGRYPFHGRVLVFLVPSFLLPIVEGAVEIGRWSGRVALAALVVFLLVVPTYRAFEYLDHPRQRVGDSHGDQRNDLLDHLEARGRL